MLAFRPVASSSLSLPSGSYIYSLAAALPGLSLAAISSDDSLRLFDVRSLQVVSVTAGSTHENGVTTLTEYTSGVGTERGLLVTGGRDGKVRLWDVRSASGKPMLEMTTGRGSCYQFHSCCWFGFRVPFFPRESHLIPQFCVVLVVII
jgi:WD repeat-containing protein 89